MRTFGYVCAWALGLPIALFTVVAVVATAARHLGFDPIANAMPVVGTAFAIVGAWLGWCNSALDPRP